MYSRGTSGRKTGPWNISAVGLRSGPTKLATVIIRGALTLAVLGALLLAVALGAQAQTETVLYNFTGGSDGANPMSNLTFDGAGNLYGTTEGGGAFGQGAVFELSLNGSGGWNESVLYSFTGAADGGNPGAGLIFDSVGNLYGTAYNGGANGFGVVFELSPGRTGWTEAVLVALNYYRQESGVIMDPAGNLYGITDVGVFELSPSGGGWTEQMIYPVFYYWKSGAGLAMDAAGNIFGIFGDLRTEGVSRAFELSPNGSGGWNPTVISAFSPSTHPEGTPVLGGAQGLEYFYGTTEFGGNQKQGTVFRLSSQETKGHWTENYLHSFKGGEDGSNPYAGIVFDAAGNIYGTTLAGGEPNQGTVFELVAPVGKGGYKEKVLWSFDGTDGAQPYGSLILDSAGNLYGTTSAGGSNGAGVVFEVTP